MVKSKFPIFPVTALVIFAGVVLYFNYRSHETPQELMKQAKEDQGNQARSPDSKNQIAGALKATMTAAGKPTIARIGGKGNVTLENTGLVEPVNPMSAYRPLPSDNMTQSNWYSPNALQNYKKAAQKPPAKK